MPTSTLQTAQGMAIDDPVVIAIAVLAQRIESLSQADRDDLHELFQEWKNPQDEESKQSLYLAMREILVQPKLMKQELDLKSEANLRPGLRDWAVRVGGKIRFCREQASLTQSELAERSGLPQSHISRIETGKHNPSQFTLEKVAKALGRPLADLEPSD